jgi:hypothetical protein
MKTSQNMKCIICNDSIFLFFFKQNFKENVITKTPKFESKMVPTVDDYVNECVEVLWLMSIQVPVMKA